MVAAHTYQVIKYINGAHAQEAFPNMSIELREQIISGTHPKCWDEMFPMPEEELQQVGGNNE